MNSPRQAAFFDSCDGARYRANNLSAPLRPDFSKHCREIESGLQLRASLRAGAYAWPGGYALAFLVSDGESICFKCARDNLALILASIRARSNDGWRVVGIIGEHESDSACSCANCNAEIWEGAEA